MRPVRFAAIGLAHNHIFGQTRCLLDAGAELVGFHGAGDEFARDYAEAFPRAEPVSEVERLLDDPSIDLIVSAAVSSERTPIAVEAMRRGKDVMLDKPGAVSLEQLDLLRRTQADTGRILSILYSEHFENRATVKAGELVAAGAIGRVVATAGFGPHRLRKASRPDWFFERARCGGILTDIASHQCEQFLFFTGAETASVVAATVANRANPDMPELQDTGDVILSGGGATGFVHVDWFTPDGLPTWGDGRLFVTGTNGSIELRKYVDVAGRPGGDHLFLTDRDGVRHIDCSDVALPYGRQLLADIRARTETAMPQARCFLAMELALTAQKLAEDASHA
ncbi:Gfo/Idh/MocA family oxidoreductase [Aurantimonas sp. MSK8Z-1]|uniref:Gfo/Idh/MocA family protein n=1 Tax=Mangrovibrevibacter kandeliae TaxID=2968473 RepID=UPI0021173048|nr:Gfo/Idh/MocA family oxidoreductase [Aurantimonas sp. MSK8Z-1]MCW4116007.1 Gfo/Idh/MocA family oxidoreductase [Aurantimonas sp. MSK8Z-1]